jgi:hypothetical protein
LLEQSTVQGEAAGEQAAFQILSTTGTQSYGATLTPAVAWTGTIATFYLGSAPPTPTPTPTASPTPTPTPLPTNNPTSAPHIMLIVEENQCITTTSKCPTGVISGTGSGCSGVCAPYITSLANTYASATNWYAVQHNSPHDYLDLISGSDLGLPSGTPYNDTYNPQAACSSLPQIAGMTLVDELHCANIPWISYMESMPSNCFSGTTANGLYDPNHNPFHYFDNYKSSTAGTGEWWCSSSNLSTEGVVPYPGSSTMVSQLDASGAPDFVYLVPNDCDEMHGDTTSGSGCASDTNNQLITAGDTWLSNNLPAVLTSSWFKANGTVIITWDESVDADNTGCCNLTSPGGHIPNIVISSSNKGLGNFTGTGDHYGTLRAIEEQYGAGFLNASSNTINGDLTPAFGKDGTVSGTVNDSVTNTGISGATVTLNNGGGSATTSSNGGYSITAVPPGTYTATASATGHVNQVITGIKVTAGSNAIENFSLAPNTGGISGTVFDTQNPAHAVVGATVTYSGTNGTKGTTTTTTGGAFSFTGVTAGSGYTVSTADTPNYVTTSGSSATVSVTAGTTTKNVALTLAGSGGISGTVFDTQTPSNAIVGATVMYSGTNGSGSTTTTSGGVFSFTGVPPGSYTVSTTDSPNYVTSAGSSTTVSVTANTTTKNVLLTLTGSGGISGTVFDTQTPSDPIVGATVTYSGTNGSGSTTTTSGGVFSFTGVPTGSYTVSTTDTPNYVTTTNSTGSEPVSAGTITSNVALTLAGSGGITGAVSDTQTPSNAIEGATVTYTGTNGSGSTETTSGGAFTFTGVPPGSYTVSTSDTPNYVTDSGSSTTVPVYPNASTNNVALTLTAVGGISGTVTTNSGTTGLPAATVTYTGPAGSGQVNTSDLEGDYQLTDVPDGIYSVTASDAVDSPGYQPETFTVTVTGTASTPQPFQLTAGPDGSIAGTVTDAQTGKPIVGATVSDGVSQTTPTDSAGNYVFENEPAGLPNYTVTVTDAGYVTGTASVAVTSQANTQTNFALNEDGTIGGTVTDALTHAAIVGATITCPQCPVTSGVTNGSGQYSFMDVPPGSSYTVSAVFSGYTTQTSAPLTVNAGGTTTQNFQLSKSLSVAETFGAANTGATGSTTLAAVPSTPTGTGDLLVAAIKLRVGTGTVKVSSVTDSAGNVWTRGPTVTEGSGLNDEEIWYVAGSASVNSTQTNPGVTVTTSASAAITVTVLDVVNASTLDQSATNFGTSFTPQPSVGPTPTTAQANEIVIGDIGWNNKTVTVVANSAAFTPSVSPTILPEQQSGVTSLATAEEGGYQVVSSTGTWSFGLSLSATSAWTGVIATFH